MSEDLFSNLLPEVLTNIFDLLTPKDLLSCCIVNRLWNEVASDNLLWFKRCHSKGITYGLSVQNENPNYWKEQFTIQMRNSRKWCGNPSVAPVIISMHNYAPITDLVIHNNWAACSLDNGTIVVVDINTQMKKHTFRLNDKGAVWCLVAYTIGGEDYLASGGNDGVVRVWPIATGICAAELENTELKVSVADRSRLVRCLAVSETNCVDDSMRLVSGGRYFIVLIWNVVSKTCLHELRGHTGAIRCVKANKEIVVSASYDKLIMIWSLATGDNLHVLSDHNDRVYTIHLSSRLLVSSSLDQNMKVWDVTTGKCVHTLYGHTSLTKDITMDTEESKVVSGNADNTVKIWSPKTGDCLFTLAGPGKHSAALTSVAVVRNTFIVSSSADGVIKLWRLSNGSFVRDILSLQLSVGTSASGVAPSVIVWKMVATDTHLICATGSSVATTPSKLYIYDFSLNAESPYR